jgi:hypothetical protein
MVSPEGDPVVATRPFNRWSNVMLCTYLSLDEVNRDLAMRLAAATGIWLELADLRDEAPHRGAAMIFDLDSLPEDHRRAILTALLAGRWVGPVAVHGYGLSHRQVRALRQRGVIVSRRLRPRTFVRLRAAMAATRPNAKSVLL